MDTWRSRLRSAEIITPSNRTWSRAGTVSAPSCIDGPWPWSWDMLCVSWPSPEQFSLVRVQFQPVSGHPATNIDDALLELSGCRGMSSRQQCRYNCVSSANEWRVTPCWLTMSARSATYNTNSTGPRTEPCGTEQTMYTTDEVPPAYMTRYVPSNRYERNHIKAVPHRPNWRSSRRNSSSWSTVSKAAVKSSRQSADTWPLSAASSRSL